MKLTGPIAGGARGYPFTAYLGDLDALGYVEEEYFLDGTGTRYAPAGDLGIDGRWTVAPAGTKPFRTRLVVRRPRDPAKFNGVVVVEWLNVTIGYDIGTIGSVSDGIYGDGFAYVGVTCQRVGVEGYAPSPQGLKAWDPERYGTLSIPGDSISYDILSQAGRVVGPNRSCEGVDPLGGLEARKVVATGASQSAGRLRSYINAIHPRDEVFDGFLPVIDFGLAFGFEDFTLNPAQGRPSPERVFTRTRIREDTGVPVFVVNSETEALLYYPSRQPDTDRFRYWEIAGSSHVPEENDRHLQQLRARDGLVGEEQPFGCKAAWQPTADAALAHLATWMTDGTEPPKAAPIEMQAGEMPSVVRDAFGNAVGGIRLPEVEVPVASYRAAIPALNALEGLRGTVTPLPPEQLRQLYPDRAAYVARVTEAARAAQAGGFIKLARVEHYIEEARTTPLGG